MYKQIIPQKGKEIKGTFLLEPNLFSNSKYNVILILE